MCDLARVSMFYVRVCVCAFARACVRMCVCACERACVPDIVVGAWAIALNVLETKQTPFIYHDLTKHGHFRMFRKYHFSKHFVLLLVRFFSVPCSVPFTKRKFGNFVCPFCF